MDFLRAFLHMDGYGGFVWPAFAVTVLVMAALLDGDPAVPQGPRGDPGRLEGRVDNRRAREWSTMKLKHRRLTFVLIGVGLLGLAAALVLSAFEEAIVFFHSPTEVIENPPAGDRRLRFGGLVEDGSVERGYGARDPLPRHRPGQHRSGEFHRRAPRSVPRRPGRRGGGPPRGRRVRRRSGAGQARRELHAARGGRRPEEIGTVAAYAGDDGGIGPDGRGARRSDRRTRPFRADSGAGGGAGAGHPAADRRGARQRPLDGPGAHLGRGAVPAGGARVRLPDARLRHLRLLGGQRGQQLPFLQADALQDLRHLGQSRGLHAAVGADPDRVRRGGGACSAAICRRRCAPARWRCRRGSASASTCSSC